MNAFNIYLNIKQQLEEASAKREQQAETYE